MRIWTGGTLFALLGTLCLSSWAQPAVEEMVIGPVGHDVRYVVSPAGVHLASITTKGSRAMVVYDGVEGPAFDEILEVKFSHDGNRFAYAGRSGIEIAIILDGQELCRVPALHKAPGTGFLRFSPTSKHFFFWSMEDRHATRFWMNGKRLELGHNVQDVIFSRDDVRWACIYEKTADGPSRTSSRGIVLDGEPYVTGEKNVSRCWFTGGGRLITMGEGHQSKMALSVNGKLTLAGEAVSPVWVSPTSDDFAALVFLKQDSTLFVNGAEVPLSPPADVVDVVFSPDGKRYAAICNDRATRRSFVLDNGKRSLTYTSIPGRLQQPYNDYNWEASSARFVLGFSADSTKLIFAGQNSGKTVIVSNGEESDLFDQVGTIVVSREGAHIAYEAARSNPKRQASVIVDQRVVLPHQDSIYESFRFSPDGSRHAFSLGRDTSGTRVSSVFIDGEKVKDISLAETARFYPDRATSVPPYAFSPNSKHVILRASQPGFGGLWLDGRKIFSFGQSTPCFMPVFSPDSRHVFWVTSTNMYWEDSDPRMKRLVLPRGKEPSSQRTQKDGKYHRLYVNGFPSISFDDHPEFARNSASWEINSGGVLRMIAVADGAVRRYTITPSPTDSLIRTHDHFAEFDSARKHVVPSSPTTPTPPRRKSR